MLISIISISCSNILEHNSILITFYDYITCLIHIIKKVKCKKWWNDHGVVSIQSKW